MSTLWRFGEFEVDCVLFQLRHRGQAVKLERRVFDLIACLVANSDRVVSAEELFEKVWQGRVVSRGSVSVAVTAARRALQDDASNPQVIVTHRGRGYRFVGNASKADSSPSARAVLSLHDGFIGRAKELRLLDELLRSDFSGNPKFALVAGEPGTGKSRLLECFAARARASGAFVAVGRCREEDGAPPYWPWVQAAREICMQPIEQGAVRQLENDAPEIAESISELSLAQINRGTDLPPANARFRLFDGFARFLAVVALQRTLVLLLDDLHRADLDSLLLLEFLLTELRGTRLVVVSSHRIAELRQDPKRFNVVSQCVRATSASGIELDGFSRSEIAQVVREIGGISATSEQLRALEELTGGNPFFVSQLAQMMRRDEVQLSSLARILPATLRDALIQQLGGLSQDTRSLLTVASVVGRQFERNLVALAVEKPLVDVARGLQDAVSAGLVVSVGGEAGVYRFKHALVREAVYHEIGAVERARLHKAIGEALGRSASRPARIGEIALHFIEAAVVVGVEIGSELCCEAAVKARGAVAYAEAVEWYRRALAVLEADPEVDPIRKCGIMLALGSDEVRNGDREGAKRTFDQAARLAEALKAPEIVAEAALGMAPRLFAVEAGVHDEVLISLLRRAEQALGEGDPGLRARVVARLGMALFWSASDEDCRALGQRAGQLAAGVRDTRISLEVVIARWLAEWDPYDFVRRREIGRLAIRVARSLRDSEMLLMALLCGAVSSLECGEIDDFDARASEFRRVAGELRQPQALWYAKLLTAARDLQSGRFGEAEEAARAFFEIGSRIGDANAVHSRMAQGLICASETGNSHELLAITDDGVRLYPVFLAWRAARCWALARARVIKDANSGLDEIFELGIERVPRKLDWPTTLVLLSEAVFLAKRPDLAEQLFELLLPLRGSHVVLGFCVLSWGPAARYLGLLAETGGRDREAAEFYLEAIDQAERCHGEPWAAHAGLGLLRVERRLGLSANGRREVRGRLSSVARRLGMRHLIGEIEALGA